MKQDRHTGFTLVELMVTIALLAIVSTFAVPAIQTFVSRSTMRGISTDFALALQRARTEAISRNQCVTVCMSSKAVTATPTCSTSGQNWGVGWIVGTSTGCNTTLQTIILVHEGINHHAADNDDEGRYQLNNDASVRSVVFNSRGAPRLSSASRFNLVDTQTSSTDTINRTFCLDQAGRLRTLEYGSECS